LRLWFAIDEPVGRRAYLLTGVGLMILKYALDAGAVWLATRQVWTPLDYFVPSMVLREPKLKVFPWWLAVAMVVWSLPFLWIGVSMTLRRALDAGRSPWLALAFFVPIVNYVVMALLAVSPSAGRRPARMPADACPASLATVARALLAAVVPGVALVAIATLVLRSYVVAVFLGVPFVMGVVCAFVLNREEPRELSDTLRTAALSVTAGSIALLLFGMEGLICVVMALAPAIPLALAGALVGRFIALRAPDTALHAVVVVLALPGLAALESVAPAAPVREVVSIVEVNAPPETVWRHVVTFGEIPEPPAWFFRAGIAYPVRAVIDGEGVGALRRCEFSTGAFVEPITVWDAPRRLSFDVTAQPDAMRELSPYRSVRPPHLDGAFRARRGEFRLVALPDGRTRLEGSTWYTLELAPGGYWRLWADLLVHAIHDRVLVHVKRLAEAG